MNVPTNQMNPAVPAAADLTDSELRALAYFAVGVSSEGSNAGRDVSNRLSFAGRIQNGIMTPVGNSGFSIGTLQIDLGQRPAVATALVDAYQAWAARTQPDWVLGEAGYAQTVRDLSRNGRAITADHGRALDAVVKQRLDQFLRSDDGIRFVHERDVAQVEQLMGGVVRTVRQTPLYQRSSMEERAQLMVMMMKLQNQSENLWAPRLVRNMTNDSYLEVSDVSRAIDGLRAPSGDQDYIESGRNHAVSGAHVFNGLRRMDADNPLHEAWQNVLANPLVDPTAVNEDQARPALASEYAAVKTLFLNHAQAPDFLEALDRGTGHAYGRPRAEGRAGATGGLYASGDDFLVWARGGTAYSRIGGRWSALEPSDLTRVRNRDGSVDLNVESNGIRTPVIHADPHAAPLRPVQGNRQGGQQADLLQATGLEPNGLLAEARAGVNRLDESFGRRPDDVSDRLCASLACLAMQNGMSRIDHVLLSCESQVGRAGANILIVQGRIDDPAHLRAHMPTDLAAQTPVRESVARLQDIGRQMAEAQVSEREPHLAGQRYGA